MNTKKALTVASFVITALTLAAVTVLFFYIGKIAETYLSLVDLLTPERLSASILHGRIALIIAAFTLLTLIRLLYIVWKGHVFSVETKYIITSLSLCCFAEAVVFILLGTHFLFSYVVAFAALMLGVLLLVLRCVTAEAIEIKAENDFTV